MKVVLIEASSHIVSHRVRGMGIYAKFLFESLKKYCPKNEYVLTHPSNTKDAEITHFLYFEPFFRTLPLIKSGKRVVTVHDLTPLVFPRNFPIGIKGKVNWELQKIALKNTDGIVTDSENSKNDIANFAGVKEDKIRVVYLAPGEDFKKIKDLERLRLISSKYNLPEKFILYVGDVTWNKNLPRLLSAIKEINLTLVMVGEALIKKEFNEKNPWNQDLVKIKNMIKNDKRIITLGFIDKSDLISLYNLAKVLVMPSLYEGFGLPILEAMACGCPVVTSKEGSLKEVGGDSAYYVNPYDVSDIANGIGEVYFSQDLSENLIERGLKQAKKFSWEKTALEMFNFYKDVLNQS